MMKGLETVKQSNSQTGNKTKAAQLYKAQPTPNKKGR
jgi:hypothetical protein